MSDVIRLGSRAHHYLAIFDKGKALALYHTKRLASPAQRIVVVRQGSWLLLPWLHRARLPLPSPPLRPLRHPPPSPTSTTSHSTCHPQPTNKPTKGWTTRKGNTRGQTEWIPPPHLDHGQPRTNTYHHPEKLLLDDEDDDAP